MANYYFSQEFTATDINRNRTGSGRVILSIDRWNETYIPSKYYKQNIDFNDTFKLSIKSEGFKNVNTLRTFIPSKMDIYMSRDPMTILQINTHSNIFDTITATGAEKSKIIKN